MGLGGSPGPSTSSAGEKGLDDAGGFLAPRRARVGADVYRLIEEGVTDLDDVLKDRLATIKGERDRAKTALERASTHLTLAQEIDPVLVERFGEVMRQNLTSGSVPFRKAYLRSIIDTVEVDDRRIRIKGRKDVLERAVLAGPSGENCGSQMSTEWRARGDSNL
jgi:site-specific DNA recombinase